MLSKILSSEDCAACKFCCSFRRKSLWETPIFSEKQKNLLEKKYPHAVFKPAAKNSYTVNLDDAYKTDDPEEEAACPFLDSERGCILDSDEKPFDCSIWPLRACRKDGALKVMLENTCPAINRVPFERVREFVIGDGIAKKILEEAEKNPDMLKDFNQEYLIIE